MLGGHGKPLHSSLLLVHVLSLDCRDWDEGSNQCSWRVGGSTLSQSQSHAGGEEVHGPFWWSSSNYNYDYALHYYRDVPRSNLGLI